MNDTEKAKTALAGIGTGASEAPAGDKPGDNAELDQLRHAKDVWAGRAKKLSDRNAELEAELRKLKSGQIASEAVATLSPEEKGGLTDEDLRPAAQIASKIVSDASAAQSEELKRLRAEIAEKDKKMFLANIGARHKELFDSVQPGGDKHELWNRFVEERKELFNAVASTYDEHRFAILVDDFYRNIGQKPPSEAGRPAAPTPTTTGGGTPATGISDNQETITTEQYLMELEKAEEMRKSGDMKGWRETNDRLRKALNEGRVK